MTEQRRRTLAWISAMIILSLTSPAMAEDPAANAAGEETPKPVAVKSESVWVMSEAGAVTGIERMKRVLSSKKKRYASIEVVPEKAQKSPRVTSFQERDADGTLRKYTRQTDIRKGKGVRAFRRGVGIRIAGINQSFEAVEIPKANEHQIWDPSMLSGLALWLEMASRAGEISFKVIDIPQRASVTARLAPTTGATVGDPEGKAASLFCWKAWAGGAEVATLCGDGAGTLISVKAGRRALLLEGWTWTVPEPKPIESPDAGDGVTAESESDTSGEETGVGP
jgi:hypothetical protein